MSIELANIRKCYGNQTVLQSLNLTIARGELVAFLGPNGAGKSTTMKIMTGLLTPEDGVAKVCGFDVASHPHEVRTRVGYLPENNPLYLDMYVREYLTFVAESYRESKNIAARVESVITQIGLSPEASKKIGQLSKGYRQRVGLAQALINDPEVLILDEPTTGLDPNQLVEIRHIIRQLAKEKTVILSTHILQEAAAICDRIVILHQGKIVADRATAEFQSSLQLQTFEVEFSKPIEVEKLQAFSSLVSIEKVSAQTFKIKAESDIREQLFIIAVEQNNAILSLQRKEISLEEIFSGLTQ